MKGICFIEQLTLATVEGYKTQTRRLGKPRFKIGEVVYLKEPYCDFGNGEIAYKFSTEHAVRDMMGWANKLYMPARAARYFIEITGVRSESLQRISFDDCKKEGVKATLLNPDDPEYGIGYIAAGIGPFWTPQEAYAALIDKINGRGTWDSNPTVTVYDYKLTSKPIL